MTLQESNVSSTGFQAGVKLEGSDKAHLKIKIEKMMLYAPQLENRIICIKFPIP